MKLNEKFKNSEVAKVFGSDMDLNLQLTEKSLEHIIESFDYHRRIANHKLRYGALNINFNEILQGHVHRAISEVLKGVLHQLEDIEQSEKDCAAKDYMKNSSYDFSLLAKKNRFL
ncbi:hypothetical protein S726_005117 [Salmonella enterica subsp. enterica]|nr:hypothetical protein [Salmonella enterica subsp. enterica]